MAEHEVSSPSAPLTPEFVSGLMRQSAPRRSLTDERHAQVSNQEPHASRVPVSCETLRQLAAMAPSGVLGGR